MKQFTLALLVSAALVQAGLALAGSVPTGEQTILGDQLLVKNPSTVEKRKITVKAKEKNSPAAVVGNPTIAGGNAYVRAEGDNPSEQIFGLPQGTDAKGKPLWTGDAVKGFKYKDAAGQNGPVKTVQIKRTSKGVFTIMMQIDGKLGPVGVVPPNLGDGGCAALQLVDGDVYSMLFAPGDVEVTNKGATLFKAAKPSLEGTCFPPETTTTTSTSTSTSSTSSSSTSSTSSTVTTTTSTTVTTIFAGPAFPPVGGSVEFSFTGDAGQPGGANVSLFGYSPTTWTALYWGPFDANLPAAGLDGSTHVLSTFLGISGSGDTVATWEGSSSWTNPADSMVYVVPIRFTLTITSPASGLSFVPSTSIPGLDPGAGTGIDAVIDVAPAGTATNMTTNWSFTADIPTDAAGFIPLSNVPTTGGGLTLSSFGGGFYSQP
ncbi:MAG TPA: hypothetical protein VGR62_15265 [Candidatus Binatia bacterium]|jgi:hypothetical protein|nr:hypothetical protein [Candidatus Binatia bacterium]